MKSSLRFKVFGALCLAALCGSAATNAAGADQRLVVHEWGTFTVLQNENGQPLPGVNVNEEPLPPFVHRLMPGLIRQLDQLSPVSGPRSKGIVASHPYAIMRMETPVIYFYPSDPKKTQTVDVSVGFRGGWISEWYPNAEVSAPGFRNQRSHVGIVSPKQTGKIHWRGIQIGGDREPPATDDHVWLAPRDVDATVVSTPKGETEQYLFYRGVANIQSPLRVVRDSKNSLLRIQTNQPVQDPEDQAFAVMWLVDIRKDGKTAFRSFRSLMGRIGEDQHTLATAPATFDESDYSAENMPLLRDEMRKALIDEGLFPREADAMLNTWELSYFKSAGLRLFFTLPRKWTDEVLPLNVSVPAKIERAMIGRIEIVTPAQQALLKKIGRSEPSTSAWFYDWMKKLPQNEQSAAWRALTMEEKSFADLGIDVPEDFQAFLDLGRFRDALLRDEMRRRPNQNLEKFARNYYLHHIDKPPAELQTSGSAKTVSARPSRPQ